METIKNRLCLYRKFPSEFVKKSAINVCEGMVLQNGGVVLQKLVVYMASMIVNLAQTLKSFVFPFLLAEYLMTHVYASHLRTPARHSSNAD